MLPVWERKLVGDRQGQEEVGGEGAGGTSQQVAWEPKRAVGVAGGQAPGGLAESRYAEPGAESRGLGDLTTLQAHLTSPICFPQPAHPSFPFPTKPLPGPSFIPDDKRDESPLHTQHQDTDDTADTHRAGVLLSAHLTLKHLGSKMHSCHAVPHEITIFQKKNHT